MEGNNDNDNNSNSGEFTEEFDPKPNSSTLQHRNNTNFRLCSVETAAALIYSSSTPDDSIDNDDELDESVTQIRKKKLTKTVRRKQDSNKPNYHRIALPSRRLEVKSPAQCMVLYSSLTDLQSSHHQTSKPSKHVKSATIVRTTVEISSDSSDCQKSVVYSSSDDDYVVKVVKSATKRPTSKKDQPGLKSLLNIRPLQASPTPTFIMPSYTWQAQRSPSSLGLSSNSVLANNIREMFLKNYGNPPATKISFDATRFLRESPLEQEQSPPEAIAVAMHPQQRPRSNHRQYSHRRPIVLPSRPKTSACCTSSKPKSPAATKPSSNSNTIRPTSTRQAPVAALRSSTFRGRCQADDMVETSESTEGRKQTQASKTPRVSITSNMMPVYYIGGNNGSALVDAPLQALGWRRITDKYTDQFRFKWCDVKSQINFSSFREGDQIVNHIPNSQMLTNKLGLLNSLQDYDRYMLQNRRRVMRLYSFYPETYRLDEKLDREAFLQTYKDGEIWICKPTGLNQGIGIHLVRTIDEARQLADDRENRMTQAKNHARQPMGRIVQRYILRPLLLEGKKFDIRCYMLIASTAPWLVLYHHGYIRLSMHKYHPDSPDLTVHLTNQYIQKKDANYKEVKESTAWTMDQFNDYINDNFVEAKNLERDWARNYLSKQIQRIIVHIFSAVKNKLSSKVGFFELYGLDFMIDENMKVILIEVNTNPSLSTNVGPLADVIPGIVADSVNLAIECFDKTRKGQPLLPLKLETGFNIVFHGQRKTIDLGPVNNSESMPTNEASGDEPNENNWLARLASRPRSSSISASRPIQKPRSALPGFTFGMRPDGSRLQSQPVSSQPSSNKPMKITNNNNSSSSTSGNGNGTSNASTTKVALKFINEDHSTKANPATREFFLYAPSVSDVQNGVGDEGVSIEKNVGSPSVNIRQVSLNNWENYAVQEDQAPPMAYRTYNYPKSKQPQQPVSPGTGLRHVWNSAGTMLDSEDSSWTDLTESLSEDNFSNASAKVQPSAGPIFKPFRVVYFNQENGTSTTVDRRASNLRRTRSLSPVKPGNPPHTPVPNHGRSIPAPVRSSASPAVVAAPRQRKVRQTLSTSVATVRMAKSDGTVSDISNSPPESADQTSTTGNSPLRSTPHVEPSLRSSLPMSGNTHSAVYQRQGTFAPMTLPTVRLKLTQVQFPYPLVAGQPIASFPVSALAQSQSPYMASPRTKSKERKDRGN